MPTETAMMNIKEVAEYLSVHSATIYKYAQTGKIPAFKIGSDWRFHKKYIDQWIEDQMGKNGRTK